MRFDRRKTSPLPQFAPRSHSRLWGLMLALMFVLLSIKIAAEPATWAWLFPRGSDQTTAIPSLSLSSYEIRSDETDKRRADEFHSSDLHVADLADQSPRSGSHVPDLFGASTLSSVKDNTLSIRSTERSAFNAIFNQLSQLSDSAIGIAADSTTTFPAVMIEPDHYRGRLIRIEGIVRRVTTLPPFEWQERESPLYELWVFTSDSGDNPWRVLALDVPEQLRGEVQGNPSVRLAGVFFKRQGYETLQHDLHVAPLLLAKSVQLVRSSATAPQANSPSVWLVTGLILFAGSLFLFLWRLSHLNRILLRPRTQVALHARQDNSVTSDSAGTIDPSEFLATLSADSTISTNAADQHLRTRDVHRSS